MSTNREFSLEPPRKSKARQLEEVLPSIETALEMGHSHATIFEYIKDTLGLDLTFYYYQVTLFRLRKKRDAQLAAKAATGGAVRRSQPSPLPELQSADKTDQKPAGKFKYDLHAPIDDFFS